MSRDSTLILVMVVLALSDIVVTYWTKYKHRKRMEIIGKILKGLPLEEVPKSVKVFKP